MIKLLVLDLDGTLYNSKVELTERNRMAIIEAQKKGTRIALASGRSYFILEALCEELQLAKYDGFVIGNNGQDLYDFRLDALTKGEKISHSACRKVIEVAKKRKLEVFGHNNAISCFYVPEGTVQLHPERKNHRYNEETGFFEEPGDMDKIGVFIAQQRSDCYDILNEMISLVGNEAQCILVNPTCIELVPNGMDKVNGIDLIAKRYGYQKEEILVMGDGQNDLGMAKKYPFVAMGNALDEVKQASRRITLSNDEDGVAIEIEKTILNQ